MLRVIHAIVLGLIGAGIVHIAILLLIPDFSERDAWSRLAAASDLYAMTRIDGQSGAAPLVDPADPLFYAAACRFDLSEGAVHVRATGNLPFWSASVYDRGGRNIYSFNDRTGTDGSLDFVVLTPDQMIEVRKELPPGFEKSVFVETPGDEGILVVRGFVPDDSWKPAASEFLAAATCRPEEI
jgi:uncharacterized membrane protein